MNRKDLPKANATCKICGSPYYVCKSCERIRSSGGYSWKFDCDSHECFRVFLVLKDYREGRRSKEAAKATLQEIGASSMQMTEGVRDEVYAILRRDKKRKDIAHKVTPDIEIAREPEVDDAANTESQEYVNVYNSEI